MKLSSKLIGSAMLGALCLLAPATASAETKFHIKNCSNHEFSLDIALAGLLKPSVEHLKSHKSVTMHCMFDKCNLGVTWSGGFDDASYFEHLYTDQEHGNYVLYLETGKAQTSIPSKYCIKAFALKKGDSCDIFDENFDRKDKLFSVAGGYMKNC